MPEQQITITHRAAGRTGWANISVKIGDDILATEKLEITKSKVRQKFVMSICTDYPGLDYHELEACVNRIADELVQDNASESQQSKESQADKIVALAADIELFHTPGGCDGECFATIETNGRRETWPLTSNAFKHYLAGRFYATYEKAPGGHAVKDALAVLSFQALHEGEERPVHIRIAEHAGNIWLDLADPDWRAVEVSAVGWRIVNSADVPVRFIRRRAMLALPEPAHGGRVDELRDMLNLPGDAEWKLFVAWLVMAFHPRGPYPVLVVNGEQGSAKSTLCRFARALIDPNKSPVRRPPKDDRDLMIAASNSWVLAFDNLSGIKQSLSDALCALATGGGFATRELYSDGDEKIINAVRPIMVNGIEDLATRADLMDRAITIKLPVIDESSRREESEINAKFDEARPRILGALLSAVSGALASYESVRLAQKPRMADFARWATAAESCLGWKPGSFLDAYFRNRDESIQSVIENAVVGPVLVEFMERHGAPWTGTNKDLLEALVDRAGDKTSGLKDWPKTPKTLRNQLVRLAPSLRQIGLHVEWLGHTRRGRTVQLKWEGKTPSLPSPSSPDTLQPTDIKVVSSGDGTARKSDGVTQPRPTVTPASSTVTADNSIQEGALKNIGDSSDGSDGKILPHSNRVPEDTETTDEEAEEWTY